MPASRCERRGVTGLKPGEYLGSTSRRVC